MFKSDHDYTDLSIQINLWVAGNSPKADEPTSSIISLSEDSVLISGIAGRKKPFILNQNGE